MSIAKTTRPHLLTREAAADRIEALEAEVRRYAAETVLANTRIEALEAALRDCVNYHVKSAADCRAIAAVNQDNSLGDDSLTHAIDHDIAAEDIAEIANAALAPEQS